MLVGRYCGRPSSLTQVTRTRRSSLTRFFSNVPVPGLPPLEEGAYKQYSGPTSGGRVTISDNDFTNMPDLPNFNSSKFLPIIKRKIELCNKTFYGTLDEEARILMAEKNKALAEIHRLPTQFLVTHLLSHDDFLDLFEMIKNNLFRKLPEFDFRQLNEDDTPKYQDPNWPQIDQIYSLLLKIHTVAPSKRVFTFEFAVSLLQLAKSPYYNERESILKFEKAFLAKYPKYVLNFYHCMYKILVDINNSSPSPNMVSVILKIYFSFMQRISSTSKPSSNMFRYGLLPLIRDPYLSVYNANLLQIFEQFADDDPKCAKMIVASCVKYWPYTCLSKQAIVMQFIVKTFQRMQQKDKVQLMTRVFALNGLCFESRMPSVIQSATLLWTTMMVEPLIKNSSKLIFPLVIPHLLNAYQRKLPNDVNQNVLSVLSVCETYDKQVISKYRRSENPISIMNSNIQDSWLSIIDAASRNDCSIDYDNEREKIAKLVPTQPSFPKSSSRLMCLPSNSIIQIDIRKFITA